MIWNEMLFKKIKQKGLIGTVKSLQHRLNRHIILPYKLKRRLNQIKKFHIKASELRELTLKYVDNLRLKNEPYGLFRYSSQQKNATLYSSCYAALLFHLYRETDELTQKQREQWIGYLQSHQSDDGLFRDPVIVNDIFEESDWWGARHLTLHALMALHALGGKPKKKLRFLERFRNDRYVLSWLENLDFVVDPATTSNHVQNYLTALQYARDFMGEDWADKSLNIAYEWLYDKQNPETGSWCKNFNSPWDRSYCVQTGYHIWLLFFYDNVDLKYKEKIIDNCLLTQNNLGGFGVPLNSSACEDIDSIDPLCRLYFLTEYRKDEIKVSLEKAVDWVLLNLNEDGGFVFRREEPFEYGHFEMSSVPNQSSLFATWFRTLSLALMSKVISDERINFDWQFLNCPGLQFWLIKK